MPVKRKKRRPRERLPQALRALFSLPETMDAARPMLHLDCRGSLVVENCSRIAEYAPGRIRLCLCGCELLLEGEELTILSLNAHMTEIRGHIFRLSFLEGPT